MAFRKQPLAVTILAVAAFCAIAVLPVSFMFARHGSLAGLALLEARHRTLLLRSLGVSAGATFVALGIGLTAAVVLARGRAAFRLPLAVLTIAPLFIPPYVIAGTWISLLAPDGWLNGTIQVLFGASSQVSIFSPTGVAWCLGISLFPIVAAIVASGLLGVDRDLVDDAKLTAGRWGVFRHATLPQVRGHLAAAALLVFLFALGRYDVPSLLGVNTYPVEIFSGFSAFYDTDAAVTAAIPLTVAALVIVVVQWRIMHGRRYLFAPADVDLRRTEPDRRRTRWAATGLLVLLLAVTVYLPLIRMMTQIRSVDVLRRAVETAGGDAVSTLAWSACAATMALVVAIPFGAFLAHSRRGASVILSLLCWLPIAVPGTVVGLGVATVWGIVAHGGSHDAIGVRLVIAYVAAFMPIAVFVVAAATGRIEPTVDEIAALDGAGWAQRFFHVTLPIHWPALLGAWMLVFVLSVGELNSAVLLVPPGRSTLAVTIDNLLHYGANPVATVLCVSEALLCLVPLASVATIWYVVARKRCERPF